MEHSGIGNLVNYAQFSASKHRILMMVRLLPAREIALNPVK